jgi:hypothetical protein
MTLRSDKIVIDNLDELEERYSVYLRTSDKKAVIVDLPYHVDFKRLLQII